MKKNIDLGIFSIRLAIGSPMLVYGISKLLHGIDFIETMLMEIGLPPFFANGVFLGEIVAPVMIIIGFRTRLAGLIFAINCLTAIFLAQTPNIFKLNEYGGWAAELLVIYMLAGLSLFFMGSGKFSISTKSNWD